MSADNDKTRTHVTLTSGTMVSHYRIIEKIGAGGMGEVYLAEDIELNRKVALKFLPPHLCQDDDCRARFKREAQAAAKLDHPNIVSVFEVGEFQGRPFFSMQHVEGRSLKEVLSGKSLPLEQILEIGIQLCEGLQAAHDKGITHRDIKPSNILIDSHGRARIVDFGLASVLGLDHLTKTGSTLGTIGYMSPEQVGGDKVDHRTDLFSFGVVLYELIAGHAPFKADSDAATLHAITNMTPELLARFRRDIPAELQTVMDKALDKNVVTRYQHADDLCADLKRISYDSRQGGRRFHPNPVKSRLRIVVGVAIVIIAAIGAAGLYSLFRSSQTETVGAIPMIAVLPFDNLGNPEDEYFADGMTMEIISRLGGIDGLGVISRTSAMRYRKSGKSLSQIGKELGVDYVLEGSVRWEKAGGQARVRITPELIRVADDRHLWADNYERSMMEVFAVQEDIAIKIVNELDVKLLEPKRQELAVRPTANAQAYDYYLKGISGLRQGYWWALPEIAATAASLDSAVLLDPSFALAYAYRSYAYSWLAFSFPTLESRKTARESFEKALQLAPGLSYGHLAAGVYYNLVATNYGEAMTELNRAYSELRGDAELLTNIAVVQLRQGRFQEADDNFRKATDLDPLNPVIYALHSRVFAFRRMYADAEQSIDRAIALDPSHAALYGVKSGYYISWLGNWSKVREVVREALSHADTVALVGSLLDWFETWDFPLDSLFVGTGLQFGSLLERFREKARDGMETFSFFWSLAEGYRVIGNSNLSAVYLDSTRLELVKLLKIIPDDAHRVSYLGLVNAELGSCEEAVSLGRRAKELQTILECHW